MTLNPRQLEAFHAVMKLGSITRAASVLGISQPATSRLIKDLEEQVGFLLFRREGNRITPGYEATVLYKEVELHFRGLDLVEKVIDQISGDSLGSLRLAATSSLSAFFLPELAARFLNDKPKTECSITTQHSSSILERVALRQFDLGFVQVVGEYPGVEVTEMPSLSAVCILPAGDPLCAEGEIHPEHFSGKTFISLGRNSPLRMRIDAIFEERKVERISRVDATLASAVCSLVSAGLGLAVVDPLVAAQFAGDQVVVRPFLPRIPFDVAAVRPSHTMHSHHTSEFLALAIQKFRKLYQNQELVTATQQTGAR